MSEPYSLVLSVPWDQAAFGAALDHSYPAARAYRDWDPMGLDTSEDRFAAADRWARLSPRTVIAEQREAGLKSGDWYFEIDPVGQGPAALAVGGGPRLTMVRLLWLENEIELLGAMAVLRGFAALAAPWDESRPGFLLVHGYAFPRNGTLGSIFAGGGGSTVYGPATPQSLAVVERIAPLADALILRIGEMYDGEVKDRSVIDHFPIRR